MLISNGSAVLVFIFDYSLDKGLSAQYLDLLMRWAPCDLFFMILHGKYNNVEYSTFRNILHIVITMHLRIKSDGTHYVTEWCDTCYFFYIIMGLLLPMH